MADGVMVLGVTFSATPAFIEKITLTIRCLGERQVQILRLEHCIGQWEQAAKQHTESTA